MIIHRSLMGLVASFHVCTKTLYSVCSSVVRHVKVVLKRAHRPYYARRAIQQ